MSNVPGNPNCPESAITDIVQAAFHHSLPVMDWTFWNITPQVTRQIVYAMNEWIRRAREALNFRKALNETALLNSPVFPVNQAKNLKFDKQPFAILVA